MSNYQETIARPENAQYVAAARAAERMQNLPKGLLVRLLYQESRYRPDIISGKTASPAGALGIAQIVPRWHPGIDPLDWHTSINYAAGYLAGLHKQFGNWCDALRAYNWGPGNLGNLLSKMPQETRDYANDILGDVMP